MQNYTTRIQIVFLIIILSGFFSLTHLSLASEMIGYQEVGNSSNRLSNNKIRCSSLSTPTHNANITSIKIYSKNTSVTEDVKIGVYQDNTGVPGEKIGTEKEFSNIGAYPEQWKDFSGLNLPVTAGNSYWLCVEVSEATSFSVYYDSLSGTNRYLKDKTYSNPWPSSFGVPTNSDSYMHSITALTDYDSGGMWTAQSCLAPDVQKAINSAGNGDIVSIPAGTCTWDTQVVVPDTKGITLTGTGVNSTFIIHGTGTSSASLIIHTLDKSGQQFVLTGFTYDANGIHPASGIMHIYGDSKNFRIHHMTMKNVQGGGRFIYVLGPWGLIDHVTFENNSNSILVAAGTEERANAAWLLPLMLGTANAVYIEDNTFTVNDGTTGKWAEDGDAAGRFVFRHNTLIDCGMALHGYDTSVRSTHSYEFYNNTMTITENKSRPRGWHIRGGTGYFFNNVLNGDITNDLVLDNYRSCYNPECCNGSCAWGQCQTAKKGRCDGTTTGDGNTPGMMGYICKDQIGSTTGLINSPVYEWLNTKNGNDINAKVNGEWRAGCVNPSITDHVKENRDYYNHKIGQSFDGTTGVGCGTLTHLQNDLTTCTAGVGYWATDQSCTTPNPAVQPSGTLYKCTGNAWAPIYTPYIYPHPLTLGNDDIPPSAPTGVAVY